MLSEYLFYYCDEQCLLFEGYLVSMTFQKVVFFLLSRGLCHCTYSLTGLPVEVTAVCVESRMLSKLYTTNRTLRRNSSPEIINMKICLYKFRRLKKGFVSKYKYRSRKCVGRTHHARLHLVPVEQRNGVDLELS
jgi:hypothetical protein